MRRQSRSKGIGGIITYPSPAVLARAGSLDLGLGVQEDVRLLLESTLRLDGKLGGHLDDFLGGCCRKK